MEAIRDYTGPLLLSFYPLCYVDALYYVMHAFIYKYPSPQVVIKINVKW